MASLDFPSNPTNGQTYALNGVTYYYNSSIGAWLTQLTSMNLSTSSNTQVLFNDAGLANGSSGLVYNKVAGYLGIGTSSPAYTLDVNGTTAFRSSGTVMGAIFDSSGTLDVQAGSGSTNGLQVGTSAATPLKFYTNGSGNERMRIDTSGRLLVGTTTDPTSGGFSSAKMLLKQAVNGTYGAGLQIEASNNDSVGCIGFNGTEFVIATSYRSSGAYQPITLSTSGTERLRVAVNGDVSIGNNVTASSGMHTVAASGTSAQLALQRTGGSAGWGGIGADDTFAFNVYKQGLTAKLLGVTHTDGCIIMKGGNNAATGTGICFPATQVSSSDANTLDDYEEGTWTPTIIGSTSNPTVSYNYQYGYYVKIGSMVNLAWFINRSTCSGGSGALGVGGNPFQAGSSFSQTPFWGICNFEYVTYGTTIPQAYLSAGGTNIYFANMASASSWAGLQCSALGSNGWYCGSISFRTNT